MKFSVTFRNILSIVYALESQLRWNALVYVESQNKMNLCFMNHLDYLNGVFVPCRLVCMVMQPTQRASLDSEEWLRLCSKRYIATTFMCPLFFHQTLPLQGLKKVPHSLFCGLHHFYQKSFNSKYQTSSFTM